MRYGLTVWYKKNPTTTTTTTTYKAAVCCWLVVLCSHSHPVARVQPSVCSPSSPRVPNWLRVWRRADCDKVLEVLFFFFFIFVQSVCIFRLSSALSRLAFPLIGRTWLRGAWKAVIVHRAERHTWKSSHAVNRSVLQFFKPSTCTLNGQAPRSSFFLFFFFIGYDNYITVHNVTLRKTFSRGHKKEMEPQKSALNVSSFMSHSSRTVGEGTEGRERRGSPDSSWHSLCHAVAPSAQLKWIF